jgi:hypothetical protein
MEGPAWASAQQSVTSERHDSGCNLVNLCARVLWLATEGRLGISTATVDKRAVCRGCLLAGWRAEGSSSSSSTTQLTSHVVCAVLVWLQVPAAGAGVERVHCTHQQPAPRVCQREGLLLPGEAEAAGWASGWKLIFEAPPTSWRRCCLLTWTTLWCLIFRMLFLNPGTG